MDVDSIPLGYIGDAKLLIAQQLQKQFAGMTQLKFLTSVGLHQAAE
jgi:hypothetical protein